MLHCKKFLNQKLNKLKSFLILSIQGGLSSIFPKSRLCFVKKNEKKCILHLLNISAFIC